MAPADEIAAYTARHAGQIREVVNRNALVSRLVLQGYNVYLPVYDAGIDFVLHREIDDTLLKVQLKSRWTIDRKYLGRDLWIAFADANVGDWYLMPHDEMVDLGTRMGFTGQASWTEKGLYHRGPLSQAMREICEPYRLPDDANAATTADQE
ncbi:MAG: hypothetical protein Q7R40_15080 [Phaeospirillum sp.]|nr:hypothetical protein [Phaeospirillum sp.]